MSERTACALVVAALLMPGLLPGQSQSELEARLARLRAESVALDSVVALQQARESARRGWRLTRAGLLAVQYEAADGGLVEPVAARAWAALHRRYGALVETSDTIVIRVARVSGASQEDSLPAQDRPLEVRRTGRFRPGMTTTSPVLRAPVTTDDIVQTVILVGGEQVWATVDSTLARWHPGVPTLAPSVWQGERTYVQLASSPFEGSRFCFTGDLASCGRMLGLVANPLDPVASYSPQERRVFAGRLARGYLPNPVEGLGRACMDRGEQAVCDSLLVLRPVSNLPLVPLDQDARGLLLVLAIEAGGDGALERLATSRERPLAERLAAAARLPADSLLSRWREAVMRSRPSQVAVQRGSGWVALGWSMILFGLALGSSRWR